MVGVTLFDRWDRIICMNTSLRPSFWLVHLLASCRLSPAHSSCRVHKATLEGGPWPQPCLTCGQSGPSPERRKGERKSDRPGQKHRDPMEGGTKRPETHPWGGRVASLSPCCLPDPVPFPLLFRPHLLSDGQDCWALGKTLPGPLTSLCRKVFLLHLEVATGPCPPASLWPITGCLCLSCSRGPGTAILISHGARLRGGGGEPFSSASLWFPLCVVH